jgi:Cu/Ag efflux protein CusF
MRGPGARAALAAAALAACSRPPAPAGPVQRYTVRGEVVRLPDPGRPGPEIAVRHEAIPGFVDRTGAVVGMHAMVMPFAVGPEVPLAGLAPGDKVELRFAVDWQKVAFWVEAIQKLPATTPLDFGAGTTR